MKAILSVLVSFAMVVLFGTSLGLAQDKGKDAKAATTVKGQSTVKVLLDNDKVKVIERTYKPGDTNEGNDFSSMYRVNHTVKGGTFERTYADGKKEKIEVKTGMVRYIEPAKGSGGKWVTKNIGSTEIVSVVTVLK